jgi:hypothetical protein
MIRRATGGEPDFNWEFYKNTAKLKLKQIELEMKANLGE